MGRNISGELQNGGAQSQKLSKIWITLDRPFWKLSKIFFSKNCYNLYLLIIFIIKIELQNVWFFSNHSSVHICFYKSLENLFKPLNQETEFFIKYISKLAKKVNTNVNTIFFPNIFSFIIRICKWLKAFSASHQAPIFFS